MNLDMRIGDVAAATGVGVATLRAWERRYGVLRPRRSAGGHRLYGPADVIRVRIMKELIASGMRASEASLRLVAVLEEPLAAGSRTVPPVDTASVARRRDELWQVIGALDAPATLAGLRDTIDSVGVPVVFDQVLVPLLHRLGETWRESPENVAREHFASTMIRASLTERLASSAPGPRLLAFCPAGERHDIGLLMAVLVFVQRGWQPFVIGGDTPQATVDALLRDLSPELVVAATIRRRTALAVLEELRAGRTPAVVGGAGFMTDDARDDHVVVHTGTYLGLVELVVPGRAR